MPAKVAFIYFYFSVKHFQMRAAVKYKQAQPVEIISYDILLMPTNWAAVLAITPATNSSMSLFCLY